MSHLVRLGFIFAKAIISDFVLCCLGSSTQTS